MLAHRLDRVPEAARPEAEGDATAREQVEARGGSREDGGLTQREVEHVSGDVHAFGARRHPGDEGPRVEEGRLVRVILKSDEVEAELLGELREGDRLLGRRRHGGDEGSELEGVSVVRHEFSIPRPLRHRNAPVSDLQ